jgi:hypothetical protein
LGQAWWSWHGSAYWITRSEADLGLHEQTSGIYLRADPADVRVLDAGDPQARVALIAARLREWRPIANS